MGLPQFYENTPVDTTPPISPLIGTLNQPVSSLMKESTWRSICRGVNELQLLHAAGIFCPFTLAHPSIPDPRHRFLWQTALLVSVCGDKETSTGGQTATKALHPTCPKTGSRSCQGQPRSEHRKDAMCKQCKLPSRAFRTVKDSAGMGCPVWDADLPDSVNNWRQSKRDTQQ